MGSNPYNFGEYTRTLLGSNPYNFGDFFHQRTIDFLRYGKLNFQFIGFIHFCIWDFTSFLFIPVQLWGFYIIISVQKPIDCTDMVNIIYLAFMENMVSNKIQPVRVTNRFATQARIGHTDVRILRLLFGMIGDIDPFDEDTPMEGFIPLNLLELFVESQSDNKHKGSLGYVKRTMKKLMERNFIEYPTEIEHKGEILSGYRVLLDRVEPRKHNDIKGYYYRFHEDMRPDFKGLHRNFVTFHVPKSIRSGTGLRLSLALISEHNKMKAATGKKVTIYRIELEEFKRLLWLEDKYKEFDNLRRRVIEKSIDDINKAGFMYVRCEFERENKKVTYIIFHIQNGELTEIKQGMKSLMAQENTPLLPNQTPPSFASKTQQQEDFEPIHEQEQNMSTYQFYAYQYLIERKVKKGIAFKQIIPTAPSSEFEGWEDVYFEKVWTLFETKTKYKQAKRKAGAFVKWYMNGEFKNRHFSEIMETVISEKKRMEREEPQRWTNRYTVKNMTYAEFKLWYAEQKEAKVVGQRTETTIRQGEGFMSIADIAKQKAVE